MARKSTIEPASAETQAWARKQQVVESMHGVQVGRFYKLPQGVVQAMSIFRYSNKQPWNVRVRNPDGSQSGVPLATIAKALRTRAKHPVARCYAQGSAPVRRLKVNRRTDPDLARAVGLFKSFREEPPDQLKPVTVNMPKVVAHMGTCEFLGYVTTHKGKPALYVHYFAPGSRPQLYGNTGKRELYLVGGRYTLTDGGITDLNKLGKIVDFKPKFKVFQIDSQGRVMVGAKDRCIRSRSRMS